MEVKCKYCHKTINRDSAFVIKGTRKSYYCNRNHYELKNKETEVLNRISYILNEKSITPLIIKEFGCLINNYGIEKVQSFTIDNFRYLNDVIDGKYFSSSYGKLKYLLAIYKNKLVSYKKEKETKKENDYANFDMELKVSKSTKKKKGMNDILGGILDEQ